MTATNHVLAGALVAVYVTKPAIAIPLAFLAHFVMDALPHFDIHEEDMDKRIASRVWQTILVVDLALAFVLFISLPLILFDANAWLVIACMFACASPDLAWGYRLLLRLRKKAIKPMNFLSRFHSAIQWNETPPGIVVELLFFVGSLSVLVLRS